MALTSNERTNEQTQRPLQEVGARSTMSNVWMGLFILLTLRCLTGLLETIPLAVLGAVIEVSALSLVDFPEMRRVGDFSS